MFADIFMGLLVLLLVVLVANGIRGGKRDRNMTSGSTYPTGGGDS